MRIVDLGCGTGRLTQRLHEGLGARETIGIDRSDRMLEEARRDPPTSGVRFEAGTIESFNAREHYDLIFSNAAFHWIEHHETLIPRLYEVLAPGGQLAFQLPAMHDSVSHRLADELTETAPFRDAFAGWRRPQPVLEPDAYARLMFRTGFIEPRVRLVIYPHVLANREAVYEWMAGTLLTEYEKRLPGRLFEDFARAYRDRLLPRLPDDCPFFFPYRRILCHGRKPLQPAA